MKLINKDITIGHWDNKEDYKGRRRIECALEIESAGKYYEVHYDVTQIIEVEIEKGNPEGDIIGTIHEPEYEDSTMNVFDGDDRVPEFNCSITEEGVFDLVEPFFDQQIK